MLNKFEHKFNKMCFHSHRSRGVPSHLLGSGHFDDNSSDNSTDGKGSDSKQQQQQIDQNGDESIDYVSSDAGNNNAFEIGVDAIEGNDEDIDDSKPSELSQDISPPPGEPRPENTARIRRYRLNLE